ncbi:MAG: flagellar hook-length control protein FliK [Desulfovibrionaceae bacterium]|nr:flagellar hook-length control protein FliK [Desulfovibrionaceae bacterium]
MQFFPGIFSDFTSATAQAMPGAAAFSIEPAAIPAQGNTDALNFEKIFSKLAEFNQDNNPGLPPGFRSVRDDNAGIKSADLNFLKDKLDKNGVPAQTLDQFMNSLNALAYAPTVGNMLGAIKELAARKSPDLNEQESLALAGLFSRLGMSQEEIKGLRESVSNGEGQKILQSLRQLIPAPDTDTKAALNKEEAALLCRAADLSGANLLQILGSFGEEKELRLDQKDFNRIFGPALAEKSRQEAGLVHLLEKLAPAVREMFEKKNMSLEAPSADNKSGRQAELLEILAREAATALKEDREGTSKGNNLIRRRSILARLEAEEARPLRESAPGASRTGQTRPMSLQENKNLNPLPVENAQPQRASVAQTAKNSGPNQAEGRFVPRLESEARPLSAIIHQAVEIPREPGTDKNAQRRKKEPQPLTAAKKVNEEQAAPGKAGEGKSAPRVEKEAVQSPVNSSAQPRTASKTAQVLRETDMEGGSMEKDPSMENVRTEKKPMEIKTPGAGSSPEAVETRTATHVKNGESPLETPFSLLGQAENSAAEPKAAKIFQHQEQIFQQVEKGLIRSLADGSKQIILRLDPPELGKLTLSLTMAQGEIKAVIRTENTATTQVISEQLSQLKASLEEQGFKVSSLEVETRTQNHAGTEQWNGTEQHNQQQELREQAGFIRLAQFRNREREALAQSVQNEGQPESNSASGLHLIA